MIGSEAAAKVELPRRLEGQTCLSSAIPRRVSSMGTSSMVGEMGCFTTRGKVRSAIS